MCFHSSLVSLTWLFVWLLCAWEVPRVIVELQGGGDVEWSCFVNGSTSSFQFNLLMVAGEWFGLGSQGFSFPSIRCCGGPKSLGELVQCCIKHTPPHLIGSLIDSLHWERYWLLGGTSHGIQSYGRNQEGVNWLIKIEIHSNFQILINLYMCVVNDQNDMFGWMDITKLSK